MVAKSLINRRTIQPGSLPSQEGISCMTVDSTITNIEDFSYSNNNNDDDDLPKISSSTTTTAQQDLPKASNSSRSTVGSLMESSAEVTVVSEEETFVRDVHNNTDGAIPESSYHLITPVRPDSVSTLGNMTFLQESTVTIEEECLDKMTEDEFYSTRRAITEVDEEASLFKSPSSHSVVHENTNKSPRSREIIKVRTVQETDDDQSDTTVTSEEGADPTLTQSDTVQPMQILLDSNSDRAPIPKVTPLTNSDDDLQQRFSWDDTGLDIQGEMKSGQEEDSSEGSVDWGDSYSIGELSSNDDPDLEDIRQSSKSLLSREVAETANLEGSKGTTLFWGRDKELGILQNALSSMMKEDTAVQRRILWISGMSPGIGKTALINEFLRNVPSGVIVCQGTYCKDLIISPFYGIMSCFCDLLNVLLEKEMIGRWRSQIRDVLGDDIYLLQLQLPSLTMLLDTNDRIKPPSNHQYGFDLFFQLKRGLERLLSCVCSQLMVIFSVDDLQRADEDSLRLIQSLLRSRSLDRFMFLGCHRRINISHPLSRLKSNVLDESVTDISLPELEPKTSMFLILQRLDDLKPPGESRHIRQLDSKFREIFSGNPFYSIQLLYFLSETQSFRIDGETWVLNTNVVRPSTTEQLIEERMNQISREELLVLQSAALLGTQTFNIHLVSVTSAALKESDEASIVVSLAQIDALMMGLERKLILRKCGERTYSFESQIFQQVALAKLFNDPERRSNMHSVLAHALLDEKSEDIIGDFQEAAEMKNALIAYHVEKGRAAVTDNNTITSICYHVAENFASKASFLSASKMLEIDMRKIESKTQWRDTYKKSLKFHLALSDCLYHGGNLDKAKLLSNAIITNARTARDKVGGFRTLASICRGKGQYELSKNVILKALGDIWNESFSTLQVDEELSKVRRRMQPISDTDLLIMNEMTHRKTQAKMPFLMELAEVSSICQDFRTLDLAALRIVELTLQYGSYGQDFTALAFALCGLCFGRRKFHGEAHRYGSLAEEMSDLHTSYGRQAVTHHHYFLRFWKSPVRESPDVLCNICKNSLRDRDVFNLSSQLGAYLSSILVSGNSLTICEALLDEYQNLRMENNVGESWIVFLPYNLIMKLKGKETIQEVELTGMKSIQYDIFFQMISAVFFQDMGNATILCSKLSTRPNGVYVPYAAFFEGMVSCHQIRHSIGKEKTNHHKTATKLLDFLTMWAMNGVPDVVCMADVLRIEISIASEIQLSPQQAEKLFDSAIEASLVIPWVAAFACERAGFYFISQNNRRMASEFITRSYNLYRLWGAEAKVQQLLSKYTELVQAKVENQRDLNETSSLLIPIENPTIDRENPDLIDLSDDVVLVGVSMNRYGEQTVLDPRLSFQRVSSERAIGSTMPSTGMRDAFQRVASDRILFKEDPRILPSWPHPLHKPSLNQRHNSSQQLQQQHHIGLQPQQQSLAVQQRGYVSQHYYQQHPQQAIAHPHQQQYIYQSTNQPHHFQHQVEPQKFHHGMAQVHQLPNKAQIQPQSIPLSRKTHGMHQPSCSFPEIGKAAATMEIKPSPSASKTFSSPKKPKKSKSRPVRSRSIPGRMPREDAKAAEIFVTFPKKEKHKATIGETWAELKQDLHPKLFLKDMNIGRKQKSRPENKDPGVSKSLSGTRERPSLALLPTWAVRSWSSGRKSSVEDGEEKETPVLRRRLKTNKDSAKASTPESPKIERNGSLSVSAAVAIEPPISSKGKKGHTKKINLAVSSRVDDFAVLPLNEPDSPTRKNGITKTMSDKITGITVSLNKTKSEKRKKLRTVSSEKEGLCKKKEVLVTTMDGSESSAQKKGAAKKKAATILKEEVSAKKKITDASVAPSSPLASPKKKKCATKQVLSTEIPKSPKTQKNIKKKSNGEIKRSDDGSKQKKVTGNEGGASSDDVVIGETPRGSIQNETLKSSSKNKTCSKKMVENNIVLPAVANDAIEKSCGDKTTTSEKKKTPMASVADSQKKVIGARKCKKPKKQSAE
ncbi:AAA ATPase domain containing protein [Nitzschia inconspicua]|uniref:AAA ATPase domain containing protein n=1 Tax=Nitzschia inconspicua TaxID=303405 RepID=A0A9K3PE29_9STRA|nr:AAA ATPase domain containing protein [Nitzschia inconspicua]